MKVKDILQHKRFAVVDLETTGGKPFFNEIIEIAIIITDGKEILEGYTSLIRPFTTIPPFISQLTNISDEMVQNAPLFDEVFDKVEHLLKDTCFVAHNVSFDFGFVKYEFEKRGKKLLIPKICTVSAGKNLIKRLPSYNLDSLCKHFQISIFDRHRAYGDAYATTKLFHKYYQIVVQRYGVQQFLF